MGVGELLWRDYYLKIKTYSFSFCNKSEINEVLLFMAQYWKKNHAILGNKELLDWQYFDKVSKSYNFALARERETNEIHAIYGFIPVSQFDAELSHYSDLWLSIWRVSPKAKAPMLGVALLSYIIGKRKPRTIIGLGMTAMARGVFQRVNNAMLSSVNHYYIINEKKTNFVLIKNFDNKYYNSSENDDKRIEIATENDLTGMDKLFAKRTPHKSAEYIRERFINHPTYDYKLLKIVHASKILGLIVARLQSHQTGRALRIVDFFGDENNLRGLHKQFQDLLSEYEAEYVDFYNYGLSVEIMRQTAFLKRELTSQVIIPNYFDPFEEKNVDFEFFCKSEQPVMICKADADQDRPNLIKT